MSVIHGQEAVRTVGAFGLLKKTFEGLGARVLSLTAMLGKFAIAVAVFEGVRRLTMELTGAADAAKLLETSLERMAKMEADVMVKYSEDTQKVLKRVEAMGTAEQKQKALGEETKRTANDVAMYRQVVENLQKEVAELEPTWKSAWQSERALWKLKQAELRQYEDRLQEAKSRTEALNEATKEAKKIGPADQKVIDGVKQLDEQLKGAVRTFGLTGAEAELMKLKVMGASEAQLAGLRAVALQLRDMELDRALATKGMTDQQRLDHDIAEQRKKDVAALEGQQKTLADLLTKSRELGATQRSGQKDVHTQLVEANKAYHKQFELVDALQKRIADVAAKQAQLRLDQQAKDKEDEFAQLVAKAEQLAQQMRSPAEVLRDSVKELNELMDAGVLTPTVYNRAIAQLEKSFNGAAESAADLRGQMQGVVGVASGTAEALARFSAYKAGIDTRGPSRGVVNNAQQKRDEELKVLKDIRNAVVKDAGAPKVELKKAEL